MNKLLSQWAPSIAAINLIKLNGIMDNKIKNAEAYLKNNTELDNIDDIDGYENWDAFFILYCINLNKENDSDDGANDNSQ